MPEYGQIVNCLAVKEKTEQFDLVRTLEVFQKWVVVMSVIIFFITSIGLMKRTVRNLERSLWECLTLTLGQDGIGHLTHRRKLFLTLYLTLLVVLLSFYNSLFSTTLTLKLPVKLINSLEDLIASNKKPFFHEGYPIMNAFLYNQFEPFSGIRRKCESYEGDFKSCVHSLDYGISDIFENDSQGHVPLIYNIQLEFLRVYVCNWNLGQEGKELKVLAAKETFFSVLMSFLYRHGLSSQMRVKFDKGYEIFSLIRKEYHIENYRVMNFQLMYRNTA